MKTPASERLRGGSSRSRQDPGLPAPSRTVVISVYTCACLSRLSGPASWQTRAGTAVGSWPEYLLRTTGPKLGAWSLNPMPDTRAQAEVGGLALLWPRERWVSAGHAGATQGTSGGLVCALCACVSRVTKPSGWICVVCSLGCPTPAQK